MKCPNCGKSGNAFKRIFSKRSYGVNRYCVYCNAEVKIDYSWKKILILAIFTLFGLVLLQVILQFIGLPGINSGVAGGLAAAVLAIFIRRHPFVEISLVSKPEENKKKKK